MSSVLYRVMWVPGTDELLGRCHCGAEHIADDPVTLWAWLLAHPDGHDPFGAAPPGPATTATTR